jgi:hypothetical protein
MKTSIPIATRVLRNAVWEPVEALGERFSMRGRRWPLIGDHSRLHIFPAEFRPFGIGEYVCGFDAQFPAMLPGVYGSRRQLPDLIESAKRFTSGHDHPLPVWREEVDRSRHRRRSLRR